MPWWTGSSTPLKVTFVADKPPPPQIGYQEVLMAAETGSEGADLHSDPSIFFVNAPGLFDFSHCGSRIPGFDMDISQTPMKI
jgi:hypothetical protein